MADTVVRVTYQFETKRQHAEVRCQACGWTVIFPPHAMNRLFRPPVGVDAAAKRFRCRWCGKRAARVRALYREYHG